MSCAPRYAAGGNSGAGSSPSASQPGRWRREWERGAVYPNKVIGIYPVDHHADAAGSHRRGGEITSSFHYTPDPLPALKG